MNPPNANSGEMSYRDIYIEGFNAIPDGETAEERIHLIQEEGFTGMRQKRHAAGLEAVAKAVLLRQDGWVDVKERLPEIDGRCVLVWCEDNECTYTACRNGGEWQYFAAGSNRFFHDVTHWRSVPLPPAPKAKG